jgi:hypothetical protein
MRLYEVVNDGNDTNLVTKLFDATMNQEELESEQAQSLLVVSLLNKGWDRVSINKLVDMVKGCGSEKDLLKITSKMDRGANVFESNVGEKVNIHTAIITIPGVEEKNKKQSIQQLMTQLQLKGMLKIVSLKVLPGPSFQVSDSKEEKMTNVRVKIKIKSKYDRYRIRSFIGTNYHIEKLSYNDVDK